MARGIIDPDTGSLLELSDRSVGWSTPHGPRVDVTPDHAWECADAGGGAIVLGGEGLLTWRGDGEPVTVEAEEVHRVAVAGNLVSAATTDGRVMVWADMAAGRAAGHAQVQFEPDELSCDGVGRRVIVAGWLDDDAAMTVYHVGGAEPVEVVPSTPWPAPTAGITRALADGMLGVATSDAVELVAADGDVRSSVPVAGIERLVGSGRDLAWVRVSSSEERAIIGTAQVVGDAIVAGVELPMPGQDRFPGIAALPAGVTVVVGTTTPGLLEYRSTGNGWSEPIRHDLRGRAKR